MAMHGRSAREVDEAIRTRLHYYRRRRLRRRILSFSIFAVVAIVVIGVAVLLFGSSYIPESVNNTIQEGQSTALSLYKTALASLENTLEDKPDPVSRIPRTGVQASTPIPTRVIVPTLPTSSQLSRTQSLKPVPTVAPRVEIGNTTQSKSDRPSNFFKNIKELTESAGLAQPDLNLIALERDIHDLVNAERITRNLPPLSWDDEIALIARRHSEDMAANGYFSHENLRGQTPTDRGNGVGYECIKVYVDYYTYGISENIFQNWLYSSTTYINGAPVHDWNSQEDISETSVEGWMDSEGHRKNILDESYDRTGIGVAIAENDEVYITQNFC